MQHTCFELEISGQYVYYLAKKKAFYIDSLLKWEDQNMVTKRHKPLNT
jgi:hypothetical protein